MHIQEMTYFLTEVFGYSKFWSVAIIKGDIIALSKLNVFFADKLFSLVVFI